MPQKSRTGVAGKNWVHRAGLPHTRDQGPWLRRFWKILENKSIILATTVKETAGTGFKSQDKVHAECLG